MMIFTALLVLCLMGGSLAQGEFWVDIGTSCFGADGSRALYTTPAALYGKTVTGVYLQYVSGNISCLGASSSTYARWGCNSADVPTVTTANSYNLKPLAYYIVNVKYNTTEVAPNFSIDNRMAASTAGWYGMYTPTKGTLWSDGQFFVTNFKFQKDSNFEVGVRSMTYLTKGFALAGQMCVKVKVKVDPYNFVKSGVCYDAYSGSVNGPVAFTTPSSYDGVQATSFRLTWESGSLTCDKNTPRAVCRWGCDFSASDRQSVFGGNFGPFIMQRPYTWSSLTGVVLPRFGFDYATFRYTGVTVPNSPFWYMLNGRNIRSDFITFTTNHTMDSNKTLVIGYNENFGDYTTNDNSGSVCNTIDVAFSKWQLLTSSVCFTTGPSYSAGYITVPASVYNKTASQFRLVQVSGAQACISSGATNPWGCAYQNDLWLVHIRAVNNSGTVNINSPTIAPNAQIDPQYIDYWSGNSGAYHLAGKSYSDGEIIFQTKYTFNSNEKISVVNIEDLVGAPAGDNSGQLCVAVYFAEDPCATNNGGCGAANLCYNAGQNGATCGGCAPGAQLGADGKCSFCVHGKYIGLNCICDSGWYGSLCNNTNTTCSVVSSDKVRVTAAAPQVNTVKFVNNTLMLSITAPYAEGRSYSTAIITNATNTVCQFNTSTSQTSGYWTTGESGSTCQDELKFTMPWSSRAQCGFGINATDAIATSYLGQITLSYADVVGNLSGAVVTRTSSVDYKIYVSFPKQLTVSLTAVNVTSQYAVDIALTGEKYNAATGILTLELTTSVAYPHMFGPNLAVSIPSNAMTISAPRVDNTTCVPTPTSVCFQKLSFQVKLNDSSSCVFDGNYGVSSTLFGCRDDDKSNCPSTPVSVVFTISTSSVCGSVDLKPIAKANLVAYPTNTFAVPASNYGVGDAVYFVVSPTNTNGNTYTVKFVDISYVVNGGSPVYLLQNKLPQTEGNKSNLALTTSNYFSLFLVPTAVSSSTDALSYTFTVKCEVVFNGNKKREMMEIRSMGDPVSDRSKRSASDLVAASTRINTFTKKHKLHSAHVDAPKHTTVAHTTTTTTAVTNTNIIIASVAVSGFLVMALIVVLVVVVIRKTSKSSSNNNYSNYAPLE